MSIEKQQIDDKRFGIFVYKTEIKEYVANIVECEIHMSDDPLLKWSTATVGYNEIPNPEYRNCVDWKISQSQIGQLPTVLQDVYNSVSTTLQGCVDDYTASQNIHPMKYMEALNFVRYGVGQHFAPHNDHGHTYMCTISTVAYPNNDYVGGELMFTKLGITIKPEPGDVVVFPSNFIYTHTSLPISFGVKYSIVTMFDYTDKCHGPYIDDK